jgi:hypothetical protein
LAAKDLIRKEKLDKATSRLLMGGSAMNNQNYALPGGTFPAPKPAQSHVNDNNRWPNMYSCVICFVIEMSPPILANCTFAITTTTSKH